MYVTLSSGGWSNTADFVLRGEDLDADAVTLALGFEPTDTVDHRGVRADGSPGRRRAAWSFESAPACSPEDDHLNEHLCWLLDRLEPRAGELREVIAAQGVDAEFWCMVKMESWNVDFELPPSTLARVAALGACLRLDTYAPKDAEADEFEVRETEAEANSSDAT